MKSLILEAQQGSLDSLVRLAEDLRERVRLIAARYCRTTTEEFDDLLQEAWLGLLEAMPEVDVNIGDPAEYLLKRARWRVLDYLKRQRVRKCERLDTAETLVDLSVPAHEVISSVVVCQLLTQLTITQRRILFLLLDGMTWREAASSMGCVSSNIAYHVKAIRKAYIELTKDDEA